MDDKKDEIVSSISNNNIKNNNNNDIIITTTTVIENLTNHIDELEKTKSIVDGTNHINDNNLESEATSSREEGGISCLGRVTWLHGGETEIDDEDDEDESEEDDESVDSSSSSSTETIVRQQSRWGWFVVLGSMIIHMVWVSFYD
jgi:hypothetical protein